MSVRAESAGRVRSYPHHPLAGIKPRTPFGQPSSTRKPAQTPEGALLFALRQVGKRYGPQTVLPPIDLDIAAGRTTVLIGPSGCGKSTLLRLMLGLIWPDSGTVLVDCEPLTPTNVKAVRHRVGYVVQDGGLFPHLTAKANVTLAARHLGWDAPRIKSRLRELTELVRLPPDAIDRYPAQLSGGQRQRVGLMRALMLDPKGLLLDEPLGALDPMVRADLQTDLRGIFRSLGKTVVLVTHDLGEAGYFGDNVVLLREGRVVQQGPPRDLTDSPADPFVTRFVSAQRSLHDVGR
jgi:osmoprotectant transport system ATP-binding protein